MKKILFFRAALLLAAFIVCVPSTAEKISLSQARTIARSFTGKALPFQSATPQSVSPALSLAYKSGAEELYAFNVGQGSGFVLVAGDDLVKNPVLGYCDNGSFNYDQLEGPAKGWVEQYAQTIAFARANNIVVESSSALASESNKEVGPLLTTKWDQYPVYNELCPKIEGELSVTGCSATSMAQVMKYYNYPEHGIGSLGYLDSTEYNGKKYYSPVFADFEHTTYDWANMPDVCDSSCTAAQIKAVATLMYHCGVAQKMTYNPDGSSAGTAERLPALINYFGYDKSAINLDMDYYTLEEWTDSLKADLDAGHPILYRGEDSKYGGHAFIMDGYNAEGYYHFNWGWSGSSDGFYSLLKLQPEGQTYSLTNSQMAWLHVMPEQGGQEKINLLCRLLSCEASRVILDPYGKMTGVSCYFIHYNANAANVKVFLTLESKTDGGTKDVVSDATDFEPWQFYRFSTSTQCNFHGVKDGDYKLYLTYATDNVSKRKARSWNKNQGYLDVTIEKGVAIFGENEPTGIQKVPNSPNAAVKADGGIFNLSGQKVAADWETLTPGIYLKGGEKIMKK